MKCIFLGYSTHQKWYKWSTHLRMLPSLKVNCVNFYTYYDRGINSSTKCYVFLFQPLNWWHSHLSITKDKFWWIQLQVGLYSIYTHKSVELRIVYIVGSLENKNKIKDRKTTLTSIALSLILLPSSFSYINDSFDLTNPAKIPSIRIYGVTHLETKLRSYDLS